MELKLIRKCPNPNNNPRCKCILNYTTKKGYLGALRRNTMCKSCSMSKSPNKLVYERICPNPKDNPGCRVNLKYKSKQKYYIALEKNSTCHSCCSYSNAYNICRKCSNETKKKLSIIFKGRKFTDEWKNNIRIARLKMIESGKNFGMYGSSMYDSWLIKYGKEEADKKQIEKIKKIRLKLHTRLKDKFNCISPAFFNPEACKIIDEYGKTNGYSFQHALNGGEFYIKELGYWVDGYDKDKNVVIEIDEKHHFDKNGNLRESDSNRQAEIENLLCCKKFIRVKI